MVFMPRWPWPMIWPASDRVSPLDRRGFADQHWPREGRGRGTSSELAWLPSAIHSHSGISQPLWTRSLQSDRKTFFVAVPSVSAITSEVPHFHTPILSHPLPNVISRIAPLLPFLVGVRSFSVNRFTSNPSSLYIPCTRACGPLRLLLELDLYGPYENWYAGYLS